MSPRDKAVGLLVAVLAIATLLAGCSLTDLSNLTGGDASATPDATRPLPAAYSIGGTVRGLDEGATVRLQENASDYVDVDHDGAFTLPTKLASGIDYIVTVLRISDGRACTLQNSEGRVGAADVSNVLVVCPSTDAKLTDLKLSTGPLTPPFSGGVTAYAAGQIVPDIFALANKPTITATTASPGAKVTVNGVPVTSGQPSSLDGLNAGANAISVVVLAADGATKATYTIAAVVDAQDAYVKASNPRSGAAFGSSVSLSADGTTMAVGAVYEPSIATGIDGDQYDQSSRGAGAVYVFRKSGATWAQEAYVKASNTGPHVDNSPAEFGTTTALSADGNTLVVGANGETSSGVGINGDQSGSTALNAGAVYVFHRAMTTWTQEAYIKASNARQESAFGAAAALSADGNTLVVGAESESSAATGINGDQSDTTAGASGAAYVFRRTASIWQQEAYIKPSNTRTTHFSASFGAALALSSDGNTLAVGAPTEPSAATGINGNQADFSANEAGAVYVFTRSGTTWMQEAYVKASNTQKDASFGVSVALSSDGNTLLAGASGESSAADRAGAAYVFSRSASTWIQQAFLQASNANNGFSFGTSVAISGDGKRIVVGSEKESSGAKGINGNQADTSLSYAGAVYVFTSAGIGAGTLWTEEAYVKSSNTQRYLQFGIRVALSTDGITLAVGGVGESSNASGVNGNQSDTSLSAAGAVYVLR